MKKLSIKAISGLIAIFLFTTVVRAQEDYVMFLSLNLDPTPGKTAKVIEGLKAHNAKFHAEGDSKAYIWNIVTGPRSGQISWAQGPIKYSKLDEGLTDDHNADWEANVAAHCRSVSDIRMFRRHEGATYNPANETVGEKVLARIFYGVSDQAALLEGMSKIGEVFKAKKYNFARRVYTSEFRTKDGERLFLIYPFSSWTELENRKGIPPNFAADYDSVHGEGTWAKFRESLQGATEGWYDEVRVMIK